MSPLPFLPRGSLANLQRAGSVQHSTYTPSSKDMRHLGGVGTCRRSSYCDLWPHLYLSRAGRSEQPICMYEQRAPGAASHFSAVGIIDFPRVSTSVVQRRSPQVRPSAHNYRELNYNSTSHFRRSRALDFNDSLPRLLPHGCRETPIIALNGEADA